MFDYFRRLVIAIESIARNLTEMRAESKLLMEKAENANSPERFTEIFSQVKNLITPKGDSNELR